MEYLDIDEIREAANDIKNAFESLMVTKSLVCKPKALQWRFFKKCLDRLLIPSLKSEFDEISPVQSAQLKFEVEDKLRRFYLRPGKPVDFVFSLVHRANVALYGIDEPNYPDLAGYCLLVRRLSGKEAKLGPGAASGIKAYLEKTVAEAIEAEFRAYEALPQIQTAQLERFFCAGSPAFKEIANILHRHNRKGWIISNPMNPSTKRLLKVKVKKIGPEDAVVSTMEYWYLRWWNV
ncbi:MAG: hypothetical protein JRJ29_20425, partial [Deltaproteobacteria bacterium]|nr:hypothetical protein [Deltaproteobacteria bacterium]